MKDFVPAKDVWRVFVAVDIGYEVRAGLDVEQRRLRCHWLAVKWVALQNVHLGREKDKVFGTMKVDRVKLMRSELGPMGPAYSVLHAIRLDSL